LNRLKESIRYLKKKPIKLIILITTGVILCLLMTEIGMNYWVCSSIRRQLIAAAPMESRATVNTGWISISDFFAGKINYISIDAQNSILNDLRYSRLTMDCRGFWFDLPKLVKERRLIILRMGPTQIFATVDETALNEYLDLRYPDFNSNLQVRKGGVILSGWAPVFNKLVPIELEGDLKAISEKYIRFYPTRLLIAGQKVSGALLKIVSEQLPIEFEIMKGWPLKISGLSLDENKIELTMEDTITYGR
jgi:hypothetical protein